MFDHIAPTYELINHLASFGWDTLWRRRTVALATPRPDDIVLDVACGTGDLARAFAPRVRRVVGVDFSANMLHRAVGRRGAGLHWCRADALCLPFADGTFNMTACAFGVRNFQDVDAGLREMYRALQRGGRAVILEFSMPTNRLIRGLYGLYLGWMMPLLATLVSQDRTDAYRYLGRSVRSFVGREEMVLRLQRAGFTGVAAFPLTLGIVVVYVADK